MSAPDPHLSLSPEWRSWVVENLLRGAPQDEVITALTAESVPLNYAQQYVQSLYQLPEFQGAWKASRRGRQLHTILKLPRTLYGQGASSIGVPQQVHLTGTDFYRDYYRENRPVHVPGYAREWPAYSRWTPQHLRDTFGDVNVQITSGRESDPDYDMNTPKHSETITLRRYVEMILSLSHSNDVYMVANNRNLEHPDLAPLMDDVVFDPHIFRDNGWRGCSAFWLGPAGTITPLHHDTCNIMFIQIYGRKRVRLFPPSATVLLDGARAMYAALDPETPNHCATDQMWVVDLEPGDALFLPVGWWHHVRALDTSISLAVTHFHPPNRFDWYVPGSTS